MRYWVYERESRKVLGPYPPKRIMGMRGFAPDWRVAPAGSTKREAWVQAKDVVEFQALMKPGAAAEGGAVGPAVPSSSEGPESPSFNPSAGLGAAQPSPKKPA